MWLKEHLNHDDWDDQGDHTETALNCPSSRTEYICLFPRMKKRRGKNESYSLFDVGSSEKHANIIHAFPCVLVRWSGHVLLILRWVIDTLLGLAWSDSGRSKRSKTFGTKSCNLIGISPREIPRLKNGIGHDTNRPWDGAAILHPWSRDVFPLVNDHCFQEENVP